MAENDYMRPVTAYQRDRIQNGGAYHAGFDEAGRPVLIGPYAVDAWGEPVPVTGTTTPASGPVSPVVLRSSGVRIPRPDDWPRGLNRVATYWLHEVTA